MVLSEMRQMSAEAERDFFPALSLFGEEVPCGPGDDPDAVEGEVELDLLAGPVHDVRQRHRDEAQKVERRFEALPKQGKAAS